MTRIIPFAAIEYGRVFSVGTGAGILRAWVRIFTGLPWTGIGLGRFDQTPAESDSHAADLETSRLL
jgi:hypothetical protein